MNLEWDRTNRRLPSFTVIHIFIFLASKILQKFMPRSTPIHILQARIKIQATKIPTRKMRIFTCDMIIDPNRPARKKQKHKKKTIGNLRFESEPRTLLPLDFMVELGILSIGFVGFVV